MFKACPPFLLVIYSEMRKLCLSCVMQSNCEGGDIPQVRRWAQEHAVTFAGPSRQMWLFLPAWRFWQMLQLLPTQAGPVPASPWPLFLLDLFLLPLRVTDSAVWTRAIIRYLWAVGRKNTVLHGRSWWQEKMQRAEEATFPPTPAGTFILLSPSDLHFNTSKMSWFFLFWPSSFLSHCNLFQYLPKVSSIWWSEF